MSGGKLLLTEEQLRVGHGLKKNGPYWWWGIIDEIRMFMKADITSALAVKPRGRLATTWAYAKTR